MTLNAIAQISAKVAVASRFLGLVGSLPPPQQNLWFQNQAVCRKLHLARAPHEHSRPSRCLFSLFMVSTDTDVLREVPPRRARAISGPSGVGKGCIIS